MDFKPNSSPLYDTHQSAQVQATETIPGPSDYAV